MSVVLDWVRRGSPPTFKKIRKSSEEIRHHWSIFREIILKDSCLYHDDSMMTVKAQLLVSGANREKVLKALHDSTHGGGHLVAKRTAEKYHNDFIGHVGQRLLPRIVKSSNV